MSPEEYREFLKTVKPGSSPLPKSQLLGKARLPRNGRTYQTDAMNQTVVIRADGGIELHEVKGHWEDDARVKIKVAAIQHPWFRFLAVKAGKTGWQYETFGGGA